MLIFLLLISAISCKDTIIIFTGQLRSFNLIKSSFDKHVINILDLDIAMCIYPYNSILKDKPINIEYDIGDWNKDKIVINKIVPYYNIINDKNYTDRHINILNQFHVWKYCWDEVLKYEIETNTTYKYYIKQRFDEATWNNYPTLDIINNYMKTENSIIIPPHFNFCNGINDRLWIADKLSANIAFNTLQYFYSKFVVKYCPEQYLLYNLKSNNVKIIRDINFYCNPMDTITGCPRGICEKCKPENNGYQLLIQNNFNPFLYNITNCTN